MPASKTIQKLQATPMTKDMFDMSHAIKLRLINKLSLAEIGKLYGISKQAVAERFKKYFGTLPDGNNLEAYVEHRKNILSAIELKILSYILDDKKLEKATIKELSDCYKVMFNSRRLEEGKATQNINYREVTKEIEAIEKALAEYQNKTKSNDPDHTIDSEAEAVDNPEPNTRDLISLDNSSNINNLQAVERT